MSGNLIIDCIDVCGKPIDYTTKWIGIKKAHGTMHNSIQQYMMDKFRGNCTSNQEQRISQQHNYCFTNADMIQNGKLTYLNICVCVSVCKYEFVVGTG